MRGRLSIRTATVIAVFAVLLFASVLTLLGFYLYVSFSQNEVLEGKHVPWVITLFCVSAIIGTLISVPITRFFIMPIRQLAKATDRVKNGDFTVRVDDVDTSDELRSLVRGFNGMVEELGSIEMFRMDFISNFSHEFKTPIASIRGFAKELLADDSLSETQRKEYLQIIADEAERLSNMASNVLLLTDLENTCRTANIASFSLDEQIRRTLVLLEKQWMDKEIEPELELDPVVCNGDEEMLSHLWLNLLSNAIKYSNRGGKLWVRCYSAEGFAFVEVKDEGEGIAPDKIDKIFDRFYQADTSHKAEGNGLGLALCKRIAQLWKGRIDVKSELGKGTSFTVELPLDCG